MLIQCRIPEIDNIVTVKSSTYHFKRNPAGELVCEVEDADHIDALLSMPNMTAHGDDAEEDDPNFGESVEEDGSKEEEVESIAMSDTQTAEVVRDGVVVEEPASDSVENLGNASNWSRGRLSGLTRDELMKLYHDKMGKNAPPTTNHETLVNKLAGD